MAIIGEQIESYVQSQIMARQQIHGSGTDSQRSEADLAYLNSKTSWIKLASGVSVKESKLRDMGYPQDFINNNKEMGLAKNHVLFGGYATADQNDEGKGVLNQRTDFLGPNGSYELYPDWGVIPMPGIESIEVKAMNRGSLKKATVKLTAQNREQLAILDLLYLRLGYTVLLEWGNSLYVKVPDPHKPYATNTTLNTYTIERMGESLTEKINGFFNSAFSKNKSYLDILPIIKQARRLYQGNYDALLGKVSNFNWSFNSDGSYGVELTIISLGDVVESLKTNITATNDTLSYVNDRSLGYTQNNDVLDQHRKDNIILSLLHVFRLLNPKGNLTGKNITIKTANNPDANLGNLLVSGGDTIIATKTTVTLNAFSGFKLIRTGQVIATTEAKIVSNQSGLLFSEIGGIGRLANSFASEQSYVGKIENPNSDDSHENNRLANDLSSWYGTKRLIFASAKTSINEVATKEFTEVQIREYNANPNDTKDPNGVAIFIKEFNERNKFTKIDTEINGISPYALLKAGTTEKPPYYPSSTNTGIFTPPKLTFPGLTTAEINSGKINDIDGNPVYEYFNNIAKPVFTTTQTTNIPNPLRNTGYEEQDCFAIKTTPYNYYIRFGYLLKLLQTKVITRIDVNEKTRSNNPNIFGVDYSYTPMLCLPNQISFDWRTCIVARSDFNRGKNSWDQNLFSEIKPWKQSGNVADAMNIYLNYNFITDCMVSNLDVKGNLAVYDFVKAICDGVNIALAGVNNLEPIIDEEDNILKIFDSTPRSRSNTSSPYYTLMLYGYNDALLPDIPQRNSTYNQDIQASTFVRKVDLKTAITPEYATMVTVGAAAGGYVKGTEATAFAKWNQGLEDRFKTKLIAADPDIDANTIPGSNSDDAFINFDRAMNWTAKCFGLEATAGDKGGKIWELFP